MSQFTPTSHANDCPVCGDISGRCKSKEDGGQTFFLCVTESSAKQFDIVNGYKCIGNKNGRWATFTLDSDAPQKSDKERQQLRQQREAEDRERYQSGLNASDRQAAHTKLLAQLSLQPDDQADLLRRGLSAATISTFRSVEPWQTLAQAIAPNTPGISSNGRKIATPYSGYLVPARDLEGRDMAYQIRNREQAKDAPKYPWLSTYSHPAHLQNGELPLTYIPGAGSTVNLAEGLLKPIVAAERLDQSFIGAAGGMFASSPQQFEQWVNALNPAELVLCPDGGAVININVIREYTKLAELVEGLGRALKVRWWGQTTKDDGDVDEISRELFEAAQLITWAEFLAMVPETATEKPAVKASQKKTKPAGKVAARLLGKLKKDREQWAKVAKEIDSTFTTSEDLEQDIERAKKTVFAATTAGVEYDQAIKNTGGAFDEATLENLMQITAPILVGGETGGGKTELGTQLAAYAKEQNDGLTYGAIAPTQVLSVQVAERFEQKGLPMESTAIIGKGEGSGKKPKALPAESLWKSKGNQLDFLAADEPDQWVPRVLTGILGDAADANLAVFRDLARNIPHQLWMNADPNPITADLIGELSGRKPMIIDLQREQAKKPVSVDWYRDGLNEKGLPILGSGKLYQDFINAGRRGEKALLLAGSVKKARAIRNRLRKHGIKVLLKDGKYAPKEQRLGFALAPEKAMQNHDVVILTRLVETGLDLQKDFDAVYVALSPKMEARSAYQFLSRSRSLLRGDTSRLCIYSPDNTLTGIEQLSPKYWEERLKSENKIYTGLLRGDTSKVFTKLGAIEWAIGYQARYKADSARQTFFRNELLRAKFRSLGWKIENEFSPNKTSPLSEILKKEVFHADWMEATCTARGHRSILEYSEAYAEKISDPNQQGLILECKRRKLELSALLPASDLEDVSLIFELSQDERLLPQTLLWSAIEIDPHSERIQKLLSFLNSTHIEKFELYGALEGLKNLRKSKSMLALAVAEVLAGDPCLERVRSGDDIINKYQADTQQLAAKLNANSDLINTWCRRHFGREFAWGEGCVSVVCKALDKLLGIKSAATGQSTEKAKGKKARAHNYRTAFSVEGQKAIAKQTKTEADEVLFDFAKRFSLMESAQQGWLKKMEEAEDYIQQRCGGLHTKVNTLDLDTDFSVQASLASPSLPGPEPAIDQQQMALLGSKFASAQPDSLSDDYYDSAAWD